MLVKDLPRRRFVDAVHDGGLLRLQRLCGGDVGGDHVILDQPVRVEPLARGDREDAPLLVEHDPPLGQVEIERLPGELFDRADGECPTPAPVGRMTHAPCMIEVP